MENLLPSVLPKILEKLPGPGILMLCGNGSRENLITLGWLQFGCLWNDNTVNVYVRHSRHSYQLLKENGEFTLNVLSSQYKQALAFCGTKSGSYCNKFQETGLTKTPSKKVGVSSLKEADIVLECRVLYRDDIIQENLSDIIQAKYYSDGDYHEMLTAGILNIRER